MNKLVAGALIFLVILIFATLLLTSLLNNAGNSAQSPQVSPIPTGTTTGSRTNPSGSQTQEKLATQVYNQTQVDRSNLFIEKLPYVSDDFDMQYSQGLGQYFVQTKTANGLTELNEFLAQNNMTDIKNDFPDEFVVTNRPVGAIEQKAEDDLVKARLKQADDPDSSGQADTATKKEDQMQPLADLFDTLMNLKFETGGAGAIQNPTELDKIFNEAGAKVGTPPKMLKAIMSIECGRLISSTPVQDILAWSAPGAGLPRGHGCYQNQGGYGAYGPMQFVPGTFARYGSAVNRYGGYPHAPNIQNIRDSVYAAAELFLLNSGATGPNWTLEQIKRAYVCYAAGCRQYDTGRLGSDTISLFNRFLETYNSY